MHPQHVSNKLRISDLSHWSFDNGKNPTHQPSNLGFTLTKVLVSVDQPTTDLPRFEFSFSTVHSGRKNVVLSVEQIDNLPELRKALGAAGYSISAAGTTDKAVQTVLNSLIAGRHEQVEQWRVTSVSGWCGP
jgi:hypothetical protein